MRIKRQFKNKETNEIPEVKEWLNKCEKILNSKINLDSILYEIATGESFSISTKERD